MTAPSGGTRTVRYLADVVVTMDDEHRVLRPGVVEVTGDRISSVGPPDASGDASGDVSGEASGGTVTEERRIGGLLVPGLVNTHAHSAMTLLRSAGDGLPLQRWLEDVIWPREAHLDVDDVYFGALLGFHELLAGGVTTTCEMYLHDQGVVEAAVEAGIRCAVTPGILDVPDGEPDRRWPHFLEQAEKLHQEADGREGRVSVGFGPHSAYVVPPEGLAAVGETAGRLGALVHVHVAETRGEGEMVRRRAGCSAPELLERTGVLDGRCLAAHAVWLEEGDLERFVRHGVAVAHCPGSNGKLGSGVARVPELLAAGLTVGLGTDGPASNDNLDLWEELRLAALLARATRADADALPTELALRLATRGGADALGLEVGVLAPGRRADFVRLDPDADELTPGVGGDQLVAHVTWAAGRSSVTDVWVAGKQVVRGGEVLTVEGDRARREVRARARRLAEAA